MLLLGKVLLKPGYPVIMYIYIYTKDFYALKIKKAAETSTIFGNVSFNRNLLQRVNSCI